VIEAANTFPRYMLSVTEIDTSGGNGDPIEVQFAVEVGLEHLGQSGWSSKKRKDRTMDITIVLTVTSDHEFVDFRRIP
jgi:ATP-dependent DNA helicase HFM1/MER3